jgi:hypothetical protein
MHGRDAPAHANAVGEIAFKGGLAIRARLQITAGAPNRICGRFTPQIPELKRFYFITLPANLVST